MLLANEYAAKTCMLYFPETAMLRKHQGLSLEEVTKAMSKILDASKDAKLNKLLKELMNGVATNRSGAVSDILTKYCDNDLKIFFSNLLSMNMKPALYVYPTSEDADQGGLRHFALNLDLYGGGWIMGINKNVLASD